MKNQKAINNKDLKYHFNTVESQKLFEEFTILLADITNYVERQGEQIISKGEELGKVQEKLVQVQGEYENTKKKLLQIQDKQKELLARLELVSSGRYMVKAIFKKSINLIIRILSFLPKKFVDKFKGSSK